MKQSSRPSRDPTAREIEQHQVSMAQRRKAKWKAKRPRGVSGESKSKRITVMPLFKSSQATNNWHTYLKRGSGRLTTVSPAAK
jgi:hypothetical protein